MKEERYFVPTGADGTQFVGDDVVHWPLPESSADGHLQAGEAIEPPLGVPLVLHDLDGLLDDLGERIFIAELAKSPSGVDGACLVAETSWSLGAAARFALDCAEHVVSDPAAVLFPSGKTAADLLAAARSYLDEGEAQDSGLLQAMSRLASSRRLRRLGDEVADVALEITVADEQADLDSLSDPSFGAVASLRDSLLAAVEAIRHEAFPRLFEVRNESYERDALAPAPEVVSTAWGNFVSHGRSGAVPSFVAARDAAERAREAARQNGGEEAAKAERAWQRRRLAEALSVGGEGG